MNISGQIQVLQSDAARRRRVYVLATISIIFVVAIFGYAALRRKEFRDRADWMTATLPKIAQLSTSNQFVGEQIQLLKTSTRKGNNPDWTGQYILLMTNGEYLVYCFRHGNNNGTLPHLFLARSSDGRWFYSTYHFCNEMVGAMGDAPPASIDDFAKRYFALEFNGKSEECLKTTWPPNN